MTSNLVLLDCSRQIISRLLAARGINKSATKRKKKKLKY
jgi:hypothetical protein